MERKRKGLGNFMHDHTYRQTQPVGYHAVAKRGWDTGDAPKVCTNCDWAPKTQKTSIVMDYEVWKTIMGLCNEIKVEWQALLKGTIGEDGVVRVTGYYIPSQEVGQAHVKNLEAIDDVFIAQHGIVAGIHSHGTMPTFFSATDVEDTNMSLIRHNIVVNNKYDYKAHTRIDLPCGMVKFIDGELTTFGAPDTPIIGIDKIKTKPVGFANAAWNTLGSHNVGNNIEATTKHYSDIVGGRRWCPTCDRTPEEDGGVACICWTKSLRFMLPDFTLENYKLVSGSNYELKDPLTIMNDGMDGRYYE